MRHKLFIEKKITGNKCSLYCVPTCAHAIKTNLKFWFFSSVDKALMN